MNLVTTEPIKPRKTKNQNDINRTVLMLCYFFPPMRTTGVTRSKEFARNLSNLGWQPIILSVKNSKDPWTRDFNEPIPSGIEIHRAMEINVPQVIRLLDGMRETILKILHYKYRPNVFHDWLCVPDHHIGWLPYIKGVALARRSRSIYVSCSPFSASLMATVIGIVSRKPIILDFRDAWTLNPYIPHSRLHALIAKLQEKWVFSRANKIILNTPGTKALYMEHYPQFATKFACIPNGFDPLPEPEPFKNNNDKTKLFRIVHVGHFYGPRQPDKLLDSLADIANPNIQFVQIGKPFDSLSRYEKQVNIKIIPPLPHNDALKLMQSANLLYLKQGTVPNIHHHIATAAKTYEYLATGLPILAECPPGDNAELISRYSTDSYLVNDEDPAAIKAAVLAAYANSGNVKKNITQDFASNFNRAALAGQLAKIIEDL